MTRLLGLTGSIAMGKSTVAEMFRAQGIPVWDADAVVHDLYAKDGAAVAAIRKLHPQAIKSGAVDRTVLKQWIAEDDTALQRIEAVVHPLVAASRQEFLSRNNGEDLVVLDIPLLFETEQTHLVDAILVVSAPPEEQRRRALERQGMTPEMLDIILSKQVPDQEKRARADYVIETKTLEQTGAAVLDLLADLRNGHA